MIKVSKEVMAKLKLMKQHSGMPITQLIHNFANAYLKEHKLSVEEQK
jgi:hypothetical protein